MRTKTKAQAGAAAGAIMLRGLRRIRREKGIKVKDAAAELHVSRQAYMSWEKGEGFPNKKNLIALLEYFGCEMEDLFRADPETDEEGDTWS